MDIWKEVNDVLTKYLDKKSEPILEELISLFIPYIKVCAKNAVHRAKNVGVYIPYEDFYSDYLFTVWKTIEDYENIEGYTFKNVMLRRLFISERKTWRKYKKTTANRLDKNGVTYAATQWENLNVIMDENSDKKNENVVISVIQIKHAMNKYIQQSGQKGLLIYLLYLGYSSRDICFLLNIGKIYDTTSRKKVQRIRKEFSELIK